MWKEELTWNICISGGWDWLELVTIKTRILLYISMGSWLIKAVGSCMELAGNRSITLCKASKYLKWLTLIYAV